MPRSIAIPRGWLILVGSLTGLAGFATDIYLPAMPAMAADLGIGIGSAQVTVSALMVGLAFGQLTGGPMSDAHGRRRPLLIALAVFIAADILCAFAPTINLLIGARIAAGLSGGFAMVITSASVRDRYTGAVAARVFSLILFVAGMAPMLAPMIGAQVLRFTSWRGIFMVLAILGLILLVACVRYFRESLEPSLRRSGGLRDTLAVFGILLRDRTFVGYTLAGAASFACLFVYIASSPFVLEGTYGLTPWAFSLIFGINAIGLIVMSQIGARLVMRVGPHRVLLIGIALSVAGSLGVLACGLLHLPLVVLLLSLALIVANSGLISPSALAMAIQNHGAQAGSAAALFGVARYVLGALAAPLTGIIGGGSTLALGIVMIVMSVGGLAAALLAPVHTHTPTH